MNMRGAVSTLVALGVLSLTAILGRRFIPAILWTLVTNVPAQRFYERAGWRADGVSKLDRLDGFELNETRYRRRLPPD